METLKSLVEGAPLLLLSLIIIFSIVLAAAGGVAARRWHDRGPQGRHREGGEQESYIVSGVLGLLALLMGFTFALAVDRFETRRALVLEETNAIGTTYLRTQLLEEPHRARISGLLVAYTDNRLLLARATPNQPGARALLEENDRLITELWAATASAFQTIKGLDFSSAYLDSMNQLIDLDASRKAARGAHVPTEVFIVLVLYMVVTAAVLGYVLVGPRGKSAAAFLLALLLMSLLLIIDIDSPNRGGVRESQGPMLALQKTLKSQPASAFDHWLQKDFGPAPQR
jgi:hypothetical protein